MKSMAYQATYIWSVPDGNFNGDEDAWADRKKLWTEDQKINLLLIANRYIQSWYITWDQSSQKATVVSIYKDRDYWLMHDRLWQAEAPQRPANWILVDEFFSVI